MFNLIERLSKLKRGIRMAKKKNQGTGDNSSPVKKDDVLTITIEDLGSEGEGIGKIDGYTLFVKDTVEGDVVTVKVMKTKKQYGYARLLEIVKPSSHRVTPECSVAKQCGGCQIQHVSYEKQLEFKEKKVIDCFSRIGGFKKIVRVGSSEDGIIYSDEVDRANESDFVLCEPVVGMKTPYYYRNKAQFPVGRNKEGEIVAGFYAGRTHSIVDCDSCKIGIKMNEQILKTVKDFMKEFGIPPYDEASHTGLVRHVLTRVGFVTGEVMVCLILNGTKLPHADILVERLLTIEEEVTETFERLKIAKRRKVVSVCINVNTKKTNVILGDQIIPLYQNPYITDYIGNIKYQISPLSFYQVNPEQTKKIYELALDYAGLTGNEIVWDLYCGIGTISLFLAQKAKKVLGVEIIPQAILDAKKNAEINGITNAEFFVGAAEEVLPHQYEKNKVYADVIVVDPPRKGCEVSLLDTIIEMEPKKVVYVACDPATLARDTKYLCEHGYRLVKFRAVDQFSHSAHVETVVLLSQRKADDYVEVELELDELDLTSAESKATYKEIQEYVLKKHGLKVSNLYISQVKRKCGIDVGENYNLPKSGESKQPQCPVEKEKAIKDALEHFGMIRI